VATTGSHEAAQSLPANQVAIKLVGLFHLQWPCTYTTMCDNDLAVEQVCKQVGKECKEHIEQKTKVHLQLQPGGHRRCCRVAPEHVVGRALGCYPEGACMHAGRFHMLHVCCM
jgi:hypothetical protein